jgi:PAS domain S-box-containing protein
LRLNNLPLKNTVIKYSLQGTKDVKLLDVSDISEEIEEPDVCVQSLKGKNSRDLDRSERRLHSLFDMAPDGILTLNLKGYITSANRAYYELTGYTEEEIIGKNFTKLGIIKLFYVPRYLKMLGSIVKGKVPETFEFPYLTKNGENRWGEARVNLVKVGMFEREIIALLRDVTERKEYENRQKELVEELEKSNNELERSNSELKDFTYAVSHDLKAPLRAVEAFAGFLIEDYAENLDETGKGYLTRMKDASIRMKTFIDDLLSLSRVGRMYTEIELVDLEKLVEEIRLDFETQLEEGKVEIISSGLPSISTQRIWIKQLFSNLISNGLKFNKSKIPKVWVGYKEQGDYHLFSVKDNGIGIEEVHQEKIFKIFQRLHSEDEYPGTGAGLTICKKIVETLGGSIWVESKLGKGSTFYFTIPKGETDETKVSEYPHEVDQDTIQVLEKPINNVE